MGGKDPGTNVNEGIQIAQRGTLTLQDPLIASMPNEQTALYANHRQGFETYYGTRFMGFYLVDEEAGTVRGQFPHLFPLWIAVGYGSYGLTGARYIVGLLAILGILSLYLCGSWMVGRPAAAAGAILLTLNVATVWFSRYPNAEIFMQLLVFAGILAFCRASVDGDTFFAPVSAILLTLAFFGHLTGILVIGTVGIASLFSLYDRRTPQLSFLITLFGGTAIATVYYMTLMAPYIERQLRFVLNRLPLSIVVFAVITLGCLIVLAKSRAASLVRNYLPWTTLAVITSLAGYAYFFRSPGGTLSVFDAAALRTFAEFYVSPFGLLAAIIGFAIVVKRSFWSNLPFIATLSVFSCLFFYKTRIIPEHFWTARRFLAVILPGMCLLIGVAAFSLWEKQSWRLERQSLRALSFGLGLVIVGFLGYRYYQATLPILNHVEYAGLIPQLEELNGRLEQNDLVIVESRHVSDMHTLAVPLAYIYGRNVLVFWGEERDMEVFRDFLSWAKSRYQRVLFVGGAGNGLPSRSVKTVPLWRDHFEIPEYESAYMAYPKEVRLKAFDYGVYELLPRLTTDDTFELDVGTNDDIYVEQFYAKETSPQNGVTFRWSTESSSVQVPESTVKHEPSQYG